jgi:hypothetical protein
MLRDRTRYLLGVNEWQEGSIAVICAGRWVDAGTHGQLETMWLLAFAAAVEDAPLVRTGHRGEYSGPRPPHGAYAATISDGLCDHTRAMPRPVATSYALALALIN